MLQNNFHYRVARPEDLEQLRGLINTAYEVEKFFKTTDRIDMEELISNVEEGRFLLAENEQGIVGCIYLKMMRENAYFGLLSVHPNLQGKGLARKLITMAEEWGAKQGCKWMEIEVVNLRTELFPFYNKMGYTECRERPFKDMSRSKLPCHFVVMSKMIG